MPFSRYKTGLEAALILAVGMGFGRFAFTAIYPYMVIEQVISVEQGSLAASSNYAGYLLGILLALRLKAPYAHCSALVGLLGTLLCLFVLWLPMPGMAIIAIRGLAGVFSAVVLISASLWLFGQRKQFQSAPFLYSGVGLGIALSSEAVVWGVLGGLESPALWLTLGLFGSLLVALVLRGLLGRADDAAPASAPRHLEQTTMQIRPLILLYGLAGFGYIITATYLPLLVKIALPESNVGHIWAMFGVGAMLSCFLWYRLHERFGTRAALTANLALQGLGVLMPVLLPDTAGYLLSAVLVGGTFMGTVTMVMPVAQSISRHCGRNLMAVVTAFYSVGQIIGPLVAGGLYSLTHSFTPSLLLAALALFGSAACSWKKS